MLAARSFNQRLLLGLLALAAALTALALGGAGKASAASCPTFEVLHNDRIGPAQLPAGTYAMTTDDAGLPCQEASRLFARFLQDWDGKLPPPWKVVPRGVGKASFTRGNQGGFSVARIGGKKTEEGGSNPYVGRLCPNTYTVNASTRVGPLFFARTRYALYLPPGSRITCRRAAVLFTRFLSEGGPLPFPWKVKPQTATFFKSSHPLRSAFRVDPLLLAN